MCCSCYEAAGSDRVSYLGQGVFQFLRSMGTREHIQDVCSQRHRVEGGSCIKLSEVDCGREADKLLKDFLLWNPGLCLHAFRVPRMGHSECQAGLEGTKAQARGKFGKPKDQMKQSSYHLPFKSMLCPCNYINCSQAPEFSLQLYGVGNIILILQLRKQTQGG